MTLESLKALVEEASFLNIGDPCQDGCDWKMEGGRRCPKGFTEFCSQAVYRCRRCGQYDYGDDPKGPGYQDCENYCEYANGQIED